MDLKLFYLGGIAGLNEEQRKTAEAFINGQMHCTIATNSPKTGARLSYLANMPGQTLDKLYFATDSTSAKIANIWADERFEAAYTDGHSQLMLSGQAVIVTDPALRREKWMGFMVEHFPDGPDGEQYSLIEFRPEQARIMLAKEADFETVEREPLYIAGIAIRTSNTEQQRTNAIGNLWNRFWEEGILEKIPGKTGNELYAVYTEYEGDATKPYTLIIGSPVESLENLPAGMKGVTLEGGKYAKTSVTGQLSEEVVQQGWMAVWSAHLDRKYQADFEVYKCDGFDPDHAEVDIFVGIK